MKPNYATKKFLILSLIDFLVMLVALYVIWAFRPDVANSSQLYEDKKIYNPVSMEDLVTHKSLYDGHRVVVEGENAGVEILAGRQGSRFYRMGFMDEDMGLQVLQDSLFKDQKIKGKRLLVLGVYHESGWFHGIRFYNWIEANYVS